MENFTYKAIQIIKKSEKAEVIFAAATDMDMPVIVKRLFEANAEVYRIIAGLNNSHIPKVYHIDEQEHELLVAEEYIDGCNLEEYLLNKEVGDVHKLELMVQLCDALEALHNCTPPIIHRDIKPSNILIGEDGVLKIIDYDTARQYSKDKCTGDTRLLGTVEYAAPEQFGYAQTDVRSDIYSMGVVLSEIKFDNPNIFAHKWKKIINKCTGFDPDRRYASVSYVRRDILSCVRMIKGAGVKTWTIRIAVSGLLVCGMLLLVGKLFSDNMSGVIPKPSEAITLSHGETSKADLMPEVMGTSSENDYIEGVVLEDDFFVREYSSVMPLECMLRSDALCSIAKVYLLCEQPEAEDPFAEMITSLAEEYYEITADGRVLILKAEFFETQAEKTESVLYIEFSDGRGERLWITYR